MTLDQYRRLRTASLPIGDQGTQPRRERCRKCLRPCAMCYCNKLRPFASVPQFIILIHPDEFRRGIASGRMAHLCLNNSHLEVGVDFTTNPLVSQTIENPMYYPMLLYPSREATNLTTLSPDARSSLIPPGKNPVVFVLDGTWHTARQMYRKSLILHSVPTIRFEREAPSRFRVRRQPAPFCLSTLEAIHHLISLWGTERGPHDNLLEVFDAMVETQLAYQAKGMGRKRLTRASR